MKDNIKRMVTEQGLYTQMVELRRKDLKFASADKNKNQSKFKFQGLSARSKRWFDLDFDWIGLNFNTRDPDLYKKPFQIHENTQDTNTFKSFQFTIGNEKCVESFKFYNDAPILNYCQKSLNSCCFSSFLSAFVSIKHIKADNTISFCIE